MARGWESKSVEQQQEQAVSNREHRGPPLTAEQIARQRILQQLQVACNPRHRQMLEAALAELDERLKSKE
jgi:hypothetical protein